MLKHIVMWKFKDNADGKTKQENIMIFKGMLETLPPIIPQIISLEVGVNINPDGYDAVLVSEFENETALEIYQNHPEHKKAAEFCSKVRELRTVVDYTA